MKHIEDKFLALMVTLFSITLAAALVFGGPTVALMLVAPFVGTGLLYALYKAVAAAIITLTA